MDEYAPYCNDHKGRPVYEVEGKLYRKMESVTQKYVGFPGFGRMEAEKNEWYEPLSQEEEASMRRRVEEQQHEVQLRRKLRPLEEEEAFVRAQNRLLQARIDQRRMAVDAKIEEELKIARFKATKAQIEQGVYRAVLALPGIVPALLPRQEGIPDLDVMAQGIYDGIGQALEDDPDRVNEDNVFTALERSFGISLAEDVWDKYCDLYEKLNG